MRSFLKKFIKPPLQSTGLYHFSFRLFFYLYNKKNVFLNKLNYKYRKTARIFTYHRIENVSSDPRLLCVSPTIFEEQIKFFAENFEIISLSTLVKRLQTKKLSGQEVVLTFDDGYKDNFTNALPILEKYKVPATIFVTTKLLGKKSNLEWDNDYTENNRATFLSEKELEEISKNPLVEIGSHTHSHPRLSSIPYDEQIDDIKKNLTILEKITKKPIVSFAYPFGGLFDFNNNTKHALRSLNLNIACCTLEKYVTSSANITELPRFNMRPYTTEQLKSWYK